MAVLTPIRDSDARSLLAAYGLGDFRQVSGIAAGSVNSNFTVEAAGRRFFLRIYEERDRAGAEREAAMLERLAAAGVPTPAPLRRGEGGFVTIVSGKPAAIFPWRDGRMRCQATVSAEDVRQVGEALARVHLAGARADVDAGRFGFGDLVARLDRIEEGAHPEFVPRVPVLREALERAHAARDPRLPVGLTHGDLFRDNVLWSPQGKIEALLDFESACRDTLAYDLMVTVLAWCVGDDLEPALARAMREGYETVRILDDRERGALAAEGCFAALRFAITRITDYALRTSATGPRVVKDWQRFWMRFERIRDLGSDGVRRVLGV